MTAQKKQAAIDSAMAKLTEDDKKALGLIKKSKKKRVKKSYKMTVYYMIGDANGDTTKIKTIKANNPFLPLVTSALDKLKKVEDRWGMVLDNGFLNKNREDKNISDSEYYLLSLISNYNFCDVEDVDTIEYLKIAGFDVTENNCDLLNEFEGMLISDAEYSFLVYEGYELR